MATSGDATQVAPDVYTTVFENDRVRVLDVHIRPGAKSPRHSHPDYVIYLVDPAKVKFIAPDGTSAEAELPAGVAMWRDAEEHAVQNLGPEARGIMIELK
jgi:quercetin dioxygenase-like cupin family protein